MHLVFVTEHFKDENQDNLRLKKLERHIILVNNVYALFEIFLLIFCYVRVCLLVKLHNDNKK